MEQKSPDAFRTISEVADWLGTPAHVLRFWESRFPQVKPVKRAGGRRYYRPSDMALLGGIRKLLHDDGMTIRGVQRLLRTEGVRKVAALSPPLDDPGAAMADEVEETGAEESPVLRAAVTALGPGPEAEDPDAAFEAELAAALGEAPAPMAPPAAQPLVPPAASPAPAALAPLPEAPAEDDPRFAPRPSPFPLRDPAAARARLAADPARAAAIHARLVDLAARMAARPR